MQKRNITLIITIFFLSSFLFYPMMTRSEIISDKKIRYDWLNVSFQNDDSDTIEFNMGGYSLTEFENLGIYQKDESTGTIIYAARTSFEWSVCGYQTADIFDVWKNINTNAQEKFKFLQMRIWNWWPFVVQGDYSYYSTARTIDFGNSFNSLDTNVKTPMTVSINPDFSNFDGQTLNGIEIESTDYAYEVRSVEVLDITQGECGAYTDIYTDITPSGDRVASVDFSNFVDDAVTNTKALAIVSDKNLGVVAGDVSISDTQNALLDTHTQGHIQTNNDTGDMVFDDYFHMRPRISKTEQTFQVRYVGFEYELILGTSCVYGGVSVSNQKRTLSAHVYNQYINKRYKANVNFLCTVQIDASLYSSYLSQPYLRMGDWIWDSEIGGTTEVTPVYNQPLTGQLGDAIWNLLTSNPLLTSIITIVIVAIALYVFYRIVRHYFRKRAEAKARAMQAKYV